MNFHEAMIAADGGNSVRRQGWTGTAFVVKGDIDDGSNQTRPMSLFIRRYVRDLPPNLIANLILKTPDDSVHQGWMPTIEDMQTEDWEQLEVTS